MDEDAVVIPLDADDYESLALRIDDAHLTYLLPVVRGTRGNRAWTTRSRCVLDGINTDEFYVPREETMHVLTVRLYCRDCQTRWECLGFAISTNDRYGVWGGYVDKERRAIKRRMKRYGEDMETAARAVRDIDALTITKTVSASMTQVGIALRNV